MPIYLGADHRGLELKNKLKAWLEGEGHEVFDVGAGEYDKDDDYPDYAFIVAKKVQKSGFGIVICGSGAGMAVAANKIPGIRAALIHETALAKAARSDDDINVLALGSDFIDFERAKEVVKVFLETKYEGIERHMRRLDKIRKYERN